MFGKFIYEVSLKDIDTIKKLVAAMETARPTIGGAGHLRPASATLASAKTTGSARTTTESALARSAPGTTARRVGGGTDPRVSLR